MKGFWIPTSCAAAAFSVLANYSLGQSTEPSNVTLITVEEAVAIALKAQPGSIGEAELDSFEGKPAYDIEVINEKGEEIEFQIDAATGEILHTWTDDDPSDDPLSGDNEEKLK